MSTFECAAETLQQYYKWHARIYDLTRWSFLFGRSRTVRLAARALCPGGGNGLPPRILEVGCGTGRNLAALARALPAARLTGVDLCASMLEKAQAVQQRHARTTLVQAAYAPGLLPRAGFDLVLFSYSLSMFNPGWDEALDTARHHLRSGGLVAVVDFQHTRLDPFAAWMGLNHVRMDNHLLPALQQRFQPVHIDSRPAYAGLWNYFTFLGRA